MTCPILQAEKISKSFKSIEVLKAVSFDINPGERVALLGHNGAGKTTLCRIALGFIGADQGVMTIGGHAPGSHNARGVTSYLPENVAFPKMLTGREIVRYYANLKNASLDEAENAVESVGLVEAANRRSGTYSKGMRQRLGLAQALLGDPKLLILDEPTSGLDPISRQRFYEIIDEISGRGTSVLLSSHGLDELEARTDKVAILRHGELVANAPLSDLQAEANLPIKIKVTTSPDQVDSVRDKFDGKRVNGANVEFFCEPVSKMQRLAALSNMGDAIRDVEFAPPDLNDIYRHFSGDRENGDGK